MSQLFEKTPAICDLYSPDAQVVLCQANCLEAMKEVPSDSIQLIITSPPYNVGKEYETPTDLETYLENQKPVLKELFRVLSSSGSLCWQVGNYVLKGEVFPLDIFYYPLFKGMGLSLRNRIIWHFNHGLHASKRFSGRYETLLWFTKTEQYKFNLDPIRVPSKYPGKRHFKGAKKGLPSGNPLGKNPSDIWSFVQQEWDKQLWDIPNVKSNHPEKTVHPCQFPIELVQRCVLGLTDENDWVLDPYAGVGSSVIGAIMHRRRAIGFEVEGQYICAARQRVKDYYSGVLRIRPLGKPVHQPTGREKVTQIPTTWKQTEGNLFDDNSR